MKQLINAYAQRLAHALTLPAIDEVPKLAEAFRVAWKNKHTIYICGNGGSAGNANHPQTYVTLDRPLGNQNFLVVSQGIACPAGTLPHQPPP